MVISGTFFLNAAFNFVLSFAIAAVLGPEEFGRYAVALTIAIVISTFFFDWIRLNATRRYDETSRIGDPSLRATLNAIYVGCVLVLGTGTLAVLILDFNHRLSIALVLAVVAASIATGQFEFWTALVRARFLNGAYARLVIAKNIVALVLMIGAACLFHSATAVLIALTISILIPYASVHRAVHDRDARLALRRVDHFRGFASYGVPIVAANVIFQAIILINRWFASSEYGFAEAGQLAFSTDLGIRLLIAVGAGLDVLLFQLAVRQEALHGKLAARRQMSKNMVLIIAALLPLAAGYAATLPAFTSLLVPLQYRTEFGALSLILIPGVLAYSLTQFVIGPIFQIEGETRPMLFAAGAALATDLLLLTIMPHGAGTMTIAFIHTSSFGVALAVSLILACRRRAVWPKLRDGGAIILSAGVMTLAIWPLRFIGPPWVSLVSAVSIGIPLYSILILALNVAESRRMIEDWLAKRRNVSATEAAL